jgi:hypothetical protein
MLVWVGFYAYPMYKVYEHRGADGVWNEVNGLIWGYDNQNISNISKLPNDS